MRKWFSKNKKLLVTFGVSCIVTLFVTLIEIYLITINADDMQNYITNNVISDTLKTISLLGLFDIALITFSTIIFIIVFLKIIFPNKRTFREALFVEEYKFLKDLPVNLKKELDRNG